MARSWSVGIETSSPREDAVTVASVKCGLTFRFEPACIETKIDSENVKGASGKFVSEGLAECS